MADPTTCSVPKFSFIMGQTNLDFEFGPLSVISHERQFLSTNNIIDTDVCLFYVTETDHQRIQLLSSLINKAKYLVLLT